MLVLRAGRAGRVCEYAPAAEFFAGPADPYSRSLVAVASGADSGPGDGWPHPTERNPPVNALAAGRTVKAPVFRAVGTPMAMEDITVAPPGPGEVLVRMAAGGVCHSCLHSIDGSLAGTPFPIILGDEGAGVVDQVGPGVTGLAPGDHVVLSWAPSCGACREKD